MPRYYNLLTGLLQYLANKYGSFNPKIVEKKKIKIQFRLKKMNGLAISGGTFFTASLRNIARLPGWTLLLNKMVAQNPAREQKFGHLQVVSNSKILSGIVSKGSQPTVFDVTIQ